MDSRRAIVVALVLNLIGFATLAFAPVGRADIAYLTLHATSAAGGKWGFDPGNMTKPGPFLTHPNGTDLRVTLHSEDGTQHNFYIDFNGDRSNASEPSTGTVSTQAGAAFSLLLNRTGNFTYRCSFKNGMTGTINITAATGGPGTQLPGGFTLPIDTNLLLLLIIVGAIAVAMVVILRKVLRRPGQGAREPEDELPRPPRTRLPP